MRVLYRTVTKCTSTIGLTLFGCRILRLTYVAIITKLYTYIHNRKFYVLTFSPASDGSPEEVTCCG